MAIQLYLLSTNAGLENLGSNQSAYVVDLPNNAQVMVHAGPWHARLLALGAEHMQAVEQSFMKDQDLSQPVVHQPRARLVVLQRSSARL